jgi:hypothetical protein
MVLDIAVEIVLQTVLVTEDLVVVGQDTFLRTMEDLLLTVGRRVMTEDLVIVMPFKKVQAVVVQEQ